MNVKAIRRTNLRQLAKVVGGITRLADKLDKPQSQLSHLIGARPIKEIGNRIAADVEAAFNKPPGWLDRIQFLEGVEADSASDDLASSENGGFLCRRVPLIHWKDIPGYLEITETLPRPIGAVITTANLSPLGFALRVLGDSMESDSGLSFPEEQTILIEPDQTAKSGDFVVVQIRPDRDATLKQLLGYGENKYLTPLNRRYPRLSYTPHTKIWGVVKQLVVDF